MKYFYLFIVSALFITNVQAQPRSKEVKNLQFGLKAGSVYTKITDLSMVLVSEPYYSNYTFKNNSTWGFIGGVYINYRFEETISGIYSELSYSQLGTLLKYSDIKDFHYDIRIRYEYLNWELMYKAYIFNGLHLGIGPRIGFNLTPDGLYYTSNGIIHEFGTDIRQQQLIRNVLKGRTNVAFGIGLGYEFPNGLNIDARYYYGINDVMETEVNNFHFIETKNASRSLQFTIGYALPYNMRFK